MSRRRGFTLIELLVVITIIGTLVGLLLPAIQRARESGRRMQCQNNMKQIALAVANHENQTRYLPNVDYSYTPANEGTLSAASVFAVILPHIEQANAFKLYDFTQANTAAINNIVVRQEIPTYMCPSGTLRRKVPITGCDANDRAAGFYAFSSGSGDPWSAWNNPPTQENGVIVHRTGFDQTATPPVKVSFNQLTNKDILDGTSHTLLLGETAWNFADYTFTSGPCSGQVRWGFSYWSSPYPLATAFSTMGAFNPQEMAGNSLRLYNFRSEHPGGVHFAMCDGSVRFIANDVNRLVLDALATRAGRELLGNEGTN